MRGQNRREKALKRTMRACGQWYPRACVKKPGKKIRINFSPIFDEMTVNQVGWGRFLSLQVSKSKRKANEAQLREEFTKLPSRVANLFALFSSLCEQKVSAYMPCWALQGMTAVLQKVRKQMVKLLIRIKQKKTTKTMNIITKLKQRNMDQHHQCIVLSDRWNPKIH